MDSTKRYRAVVAYDGTGYHGFQVQANSRPTIQGELEAAIRAVSGQENIRVIAAGRTDAGVHATGQVIAFDLAWRHSPMDLARALNARLPLDIAVKSLEEASPDFHPRYDARSRVYRYRIYNAPVRDPLQVRISWHVKPALDVEAMQEAARALIGTHDFATFGQAPDGGSTVRTVYRAEWKASGARLAFTIEANAFLYKMVRSIVGTLKEVGMRAMTPAEFAEVLRAADRSLAGATAPPHGLFLVRVVY